MIPDYSIRHKPEEKIQRAIIKMLTGYGWIVKSTHGNAFQSGFPDLYTFHKCFGDRWIEVKLPNLEGSKFTPAQLSFFPRMIEANLPLYILTGATKEDYKLLFGPPNAQKYLYIYYRR